MKEEEGRRNAAMEAFNVVERSIQELKKKLIKEEREWKSVVAALDSAKKQVEDQLATSKTQITTLKKKLEEIKKARELAEKARD